MNVIPVKVREASKRFSESRMGHLVRMTLFMLLFVNMLYAEPNPAGGEALGFIAITLSRFYLLLLVAGAAYRAGRA